MKVVRNIAPLLVAAVAIFVGAKLHLATWIAISCWQIATLAVGIFISRRLRAGLAFAVLSILITGVVIELIAHLLYGIRAVQGGPTHLAVFAAAGMGLIFGMLMRYTHQHNAAGEGAV